MYSVYTKKKKSARLSEKQTLLESSKDSDHLCVKIRALTGKNTQLWKSPIIAN